MNWERGLFRLWVVASLGWAAFVLWEFSAVIFPIFKAPLSEVLSIVAFVAPFIFVPIGFAVSSPPAPPQRLPARGCAGGIVCAFLAPAITMKPIRPATFRQHAAARGTALANVAPNLAMARAHTDLSVQRRVA